MSQQFPEFRFIYLNISRILAIASILLNSYINGGTQLTVYFLAGVHGKVSLRISSAQK